jgi:outer membrane murein-binding lipoprotein Lpp
LRKIFAVIAASALLVTMAGCSSINSVAAMYDTLNPEQKAFVDKACTGLQHQVARKEALRAGRPGLALKHLRALQGQGEGVLLETLVGCLVGWLGEWVGGWLVGRVGWLVGWLVGRGPVASSDSV